MPLAGERVKASDLDFPVTQVRGTTATSMANAAWTSVAFATEDFDDDTMHSTVTNTTRMVAQRAGRYEVTGGVSFATSTTNRRGAKLAVNGIAVNASSNLFTATNPATSGTIIPCRSIVVEMAIGDYLEIQGYQDSGGVINTSTATENQSSLTARFIGVGEG